MTALASAIQTRYEPATSVYVWNRANAYTSRCYLIDAIYALMKQLSSAPTNARVLVISGTHLRPLDSFHCGYERFVAPILKRLSERKFSPTFTRKIIKATDNHATFILKR
uniref:Uncharacterized protein n=1 Tax=Ascaris lumbricoides TaxID=6252 RepID=A0A9J2PXN9_ASCLU